jgi:hypothetical protein
MPPHSKSDAVAEGSESKAKQRYASQGDEFSRAFRERLSKWATKHDARRPGDPKIPVAEGPELMHFVGTLLSYDTLAESSLGETQVAENWKLWKDTYPEVAEVMLRFVQQLRADDGRSFTLVDYDVIRIGRLHLIISKHEGKVELRKDDEVVEGDPNDADVERLATKPKSIRKVAKLKKATVNAGVAEYPPGTPTSVALSTSTEFPLPEAELVSAKRGASPTTMCPNKSELPSLARKNLTVRLTTNI